MNENNTIILAFGRHAPFPHSISFPLSIFAIGTKLEKKGYKVRYYDERVDKKRELKKFLKEKPLLVGISTSTSYQIISSINIAKIIRRFDSHIPIVWGGAHPSMVPKDTATSHLVDFVIIKEGEETIVELANTLKKKNSNFKKIKGLVWKKNGEIIINKERGLTKSENLESEFTNSTKKLLKKYYVKGDKALVRHPAITITSKGCPNSCGFCYNYHFNEGKWRPKKLYIVREELSKLKNIGINKVFFSDDNIGGSKNHLLKICKLTKKIGINWSGCLTIDILDKKLVKELEDSGCELLHIGLESGSEKILKYINKKISLSNIKKGVDLLSGSRIIPSYSFVFGFPNETKEDMKKSFDLVDYILEQDKRANIQLQIYTPLPGTRLYEDAVKNGFRPPSKLEDWSKIVMDEVNTPWVKNKKLLRNLYVISVLAFRNKQFLNNPFFYPFHLIAKWRWKHKFFNICFERALYDLVKAIPWLK